MPSGVYVHKKRGKFFDVKAYQKLYGKKYRQSAHGKTVKKEFNKKYHITDTYKNYQNNYKKSLKCKLANKLYRESIGYKESQKRWCASIKKKEYEKLYWKTPEYKEARKLYRESHKEEIRKACRLWRQSPKGKLHKKTALANRRLLTKDLTIMITQQVYEDNIKKHGTLTCYLCLNPILFGNDHFEHKIPLSRGGGNNKENLDVACQKCNCSKGTKTEAEYRKENHE